MHITVLCYGVLLFPSFFFLIIGKSGLMIHGQNGGGERKGTEHIMVKGGKGASWE
jgi:hypothetical protein